jgi:hypothetical protein
MQEKHTVEIHIVMDEDGAFTVSSDADEAADNAENELGDERRQVCLKIKISPPSRKSEPVEAIIDLPD